MCEIAGLELTARLKTASNEEIEGFLAKHGDLPQANWMKLRWLRWEAERGEWNTFAKYYDPKLNFTELDCLNGQYELSHGKRAEASPAPKSCGTSASRNRPPATPCSACGPPKDN